MLEIAKITSKGQVTLPVRLRKKLRVKAGDRIAFEQTGDEITVRVHRECTSIEEALERVRGIGTPGVGKGRKGIQRWIREVRGEL